MRNNILLKELNESMREAERIRLDYWNKRLDNATSVKQIAIIFCKAAGIN